MVNEFIRYRHVSLCCLIRVRILRYYIIQEKLAAAPFLVSTQPPLMLLNHLESRNFSRGSRGGCLESLLRTSTWNIYVPLPLSVAILLGAETTISCYRINQKPFLCTWNRRDVKHGDTSSRQKTVFCNGPVVISTYYVR